MGYDNFVFFGSWLKAIETMSEENQLEAIKAIVLYGVKGERAEGDDVTEPFLTLTRTQIDYSKSRVKTRNDERRRT